MAEFTLRLRRYDPESGEAPYWDEHTIDLEPHRSVLEGILQAKARFDGSIGIRCSCRAAICGSCGVRINCPPGMACHTHLDKAQASSRDGVIEVEPMGNMPILKDLIVDMDAVHWKKIQRVTPWLVNKEPIPEREYLGPAALAKAYRFAGDPRDAEHYQRLKDLAEDPHGIYDCTHCFKCIDACPKGVAPMSQIMRLRRMAGDDHGIVDRNNGHRHEKAFTSLVRDNGLLWEAELLPRSYGGDSFFGKFAPPAALELVDSLPVITKALLRRKVTPGGALRPHKIPRDDRKQVQRIYDTVEGHDDRYELNLYITGYDEDETGAQTGPASAGTDGSGMAGAEA